MAGGTDWKLARFSDEKDTDVDAGVQRDHKVVDITRKEGPILPDPASSEKGSRSSSVSWSVGDQWQTWILGTGQFTCTADSWEPLEDPLAHVQRTQRWEYVGPEEPIP